MKAKTINPSKFALFLEKINGGFTYFKEEWLAPDTEVSDEEVELKGELLEAVKRQDKKAESLIDRQYKPKKERGSKSKENPLRDGLSVDLKEPTKSSLENRNSEKIGENTSNREI